MATMTYEITVRIPFTITLTQEEREEALAAGIERGLLHQKDIDKGYDSLDYDVVFERAIMGHDEVKEAVSDWLDEKDGVEVAEMADEVVAYEEDN